MTVEMPTAHLDRNVHFAPRNAHLTKLKCTFVLSRNVHFKKHLRKPMGYQVSRSGKNGSERLRLKNKGFALICSLLRKVWVNLEAPRAESQLTSHLSKGKWQLPPANGKARCGAFVAGGAQSILLCATLWTGPAMAGDWTSSGSFDPGEAKTMRAALDDRPAPRDGEWGAASLPGKWVALDAFERSAPGKPPPNERAFRLPAGPRIEQLYALIEFAESPALGYDAIHHSARKRTGKKPTRMTLAEIHSWIEATPGQHHAIGRFQIIPSTLARLQSRLGLPGSTRFSRETQNRMAALLIADAGYAEFRAGRLSLSGFMDNLARIWAGLPLASGKSAYHGYAGNRATITRAFYAEQMGRIFGNGKVRIVTQRKATKPKAAQTAWRELDSP